jgi:hypothetical protein
MASKRTLILAPVVTVLALLGLLLLAQSLAAGPIPQDFFDRSGRSDDVTSVGSASWSSGWVTVPRGECRAFDHNLGGDPDEYAVELWFLDTEANEDFGWGINRYAYGGIESVGYWRGIHWEQLDANRIMLCRGANDIAADGVRVRVWIPRIDPDTVWASDWTAIDRGFDNTLVFTHGLGITATDLTVSLWFSGTEKGIHNYAYGGLADDPDKDDPKPEPEFHGAYWRNLEENTVRVTRERDDEYVEQVRVVVVHSDPPDYDSLVERGAWQSIGLGESVTFTHGLNWNPHLLMVRAECHDDGLGIHHRAAGGFYDSVLFWQGAFVHSLDWNTVAIERLIWDSSCREVRVRVWKQGARIYLPFVVREE